MENSKKLMKRDEVSKEYKWNVEKLYKSDEIWEKDFKELKEKASKIKDFQGKLKIPKELLSFMLLDEEIERKAVDLYVYSHLKSDEDTANSQYQGMHGRIQSYFSELSSNSAYFTPELLSLDDGYIDIAIKEEPKLLEYKFYFERIMAKKPHTLSKEKEELLAMMQDCLNAPSNIFNMLTNADMKLGIIKDENQEDIELTEANYTTYVRSKDRRVRKDAFNLLFKTYKKYENTLGASLSSSIKNFNFNTKIRNYKSTIEASLKPNNIPVSVYNNTIEAINESLPLLHKYVTLKKKALKLDEIHMYDLYVPIVEMPKEFITFDQGLDMAREGLKPLGEDYLKIFNEGISSGWIDVYPNKGKRSGAYSSGTYDSMPYILLNYNNDLNSVSTLVHEMGHSIHSYYSKKNQPYIYADYELFCAEVASTTNEILLINHLIEREENKEKKLYLINDQLEQIRATVFRQVMFAEFEKITHEKMEKGEALTSEDFCKIWLELNRKYFGSTIIVDKEIEMEWARIPHFYRDFYVYQYATGYSAANSFASMILKNDKAAIDKYKGFLKSGGSMYPIDILKNAGVDMTTKKPVEDTMAHFENLLNMLEESLG